MKSHLRRWTPDIRSPWMTRAEAADYLRCGIRTVDRILVADSPERTEGKMRFVVQMFGGVKKIRIRAEDVYTICPLPAGYEEESQNDSVPSSTRP